MSTNPVEEQESQESQDDSLHIKPFNLISSAQRNVLEVFMSEVSDLERRQFAVNSWGFPFVPIPKIRRSSSRVRLAPENVNETFLGHPIYWISPELTEFDRSQETEEEWSIRMFYLILGFGYWTESLQWINYIEASDLEGWDEGDVHAYHMSSNPSSKFDEIGLLKEEDLLIPFDEVKDSYNVAIGRCNNQLQSEMNGLLNRQSQALAQGKQLIGRENIYDPDLTPDRTGGFWSEQVEPKLRHMCELYDFQFDQENQSIGSLTEDIYKEFGNLHSILVGINGLIATLTVPVIRYAENLTDAYSHITTYLAMANSQAIKREEGYPIMELIDNALASGREPGALFNVLGSSYEIYHSSWRRLRLAIANYERMQHEQPPFENYIQLEADLVDSQTEFGEQRRKEVATDYEELDRLFDDREG